MLTLNRVSFHICVILLDALDCLVKRWVSLANGQVEGMIPSLTNIVGTATTL